MAAYEDHALGLADTVNAVLAWRLRRPLILTFDRHYSDVFAPRRKGEQSLDVATPRHPSMCRLQR